MAKEARSEAEVDESAKPVPQVKSKKLLIILLAALLVTLLLGGGLALLLMGKHADQEGEEGEVVSEKIDKKKAAKDAIPVYVALDAFTVNLVPENGEQFLQLTLSVEVEDLHVGDRLKTFTPKLRNNVMLLLSGKKASELLSKEGKEKLAEEIRALINQILAPDVDNASDEVPIKEVLFTSFIIQ